MQVNDAGVWKNATPHALDGGVWKPVQEVWANDAGVWKKVWQNFTPALTANMTVGLWTGSGNVASKGYDAISSGGGSMSSRTISVPGKTFTLGQCFSKRPFEAPNFVMSLEGTHTQADVDLLNMHARQVFINGVLLQENAWNPETNTLYYPPVPATPFWRLDAKFATVFYGGYGFGASLLNDPIDSVAKGTVLPVVIGN